ncbi:MAG: ornithine carbamoyltransferase [Acidobacteriota bacterium]|nr:ornithine carbamoyltransferase [Acidobacteriota bacterium]MDE2964942.1 ornithine carbamoyltransferase [Acidobacteriota bacterium]
MSDPAAPGSVPRERLSVSDLLSIQDLTPEDIQLIFKVARRIKKAPDDFALSLKGKTLAMIFEKPSLRTRVTFDVGMTSMGGQALFLDHSDAKLGERESIRDVARNLERWVHGIVARTYKNRSVVELAEQARIPVINGLTDLLHPCQALADYFTLAERLPLGSGVRLCFVGDGNNTCHSLILGAARLGIHLSVASPAGYEPNSEIVRQAMDTAAATGGTITIMRNPREAVREANAVYTDVWASMGQEAETEDRAAVFAGYQVNRQLMELAGSEALFMHCLPAHRGYEVAPQVIDSPQSVVYDQAENRLHVQKALLLLLMAGEAV